jgi:HpiC1 cyclase
MNPPQSHSEARKLFGLAAGLAILLNSAVFLRGGMLSIPNASFESPPVPPVAPYAAPDIDHWEKTPQPAWYNPADNSDTPWEYLMGQFYNVPFPGQFIDNCDGSQAAFLFALPEAGLFQDYNSIYGTNTRPDHAFDATFNPGSAYDLIVGVVGGGGGMQPGATLQISLYYRDSSSNKVIIASAMITNSPSAFPTNTHLVDFQLHLPMVKTGDAWAGQHIGIQLLSTTGFDLAGGYWDLDNVRLAEVVPPVLVLSGGGLTNAQFSFTVLSEPGVRFEIQANADVLAASNNWVTLATYTNVTGATVFTDYTTNFSRRYYRTRQL